MTPSPRSYPPTAEPGPAGEARPKASTRGPALPATGPVVVTGAAGFIGSHVVDALRAGGIAAHGLARHGSDIDDDLSDVGRLVELLQSAGAASVVHCAWSGHPRNEGVAHDEQVGKNLLPSLHVALAAGLAGVEHVVFVSTGGALAVRPAPGLPPPAYGWAKATAAAMMQATAASFGYSLTVLRPTAVYGPGQDVGRGLGAVSIFASRLLRGERIEVLGSLDVSRDFLHVEDLAQLVVCCVAQRTAGVFEAGGPAAVTLRELIELLAQATGIMPDVAIVERSGVDQDRVQLDNTEVTATTGWQPQRTLADALPAVISDLIERLGLGERHAAILAGTRRGVS